MKNRKLSVIIIWILSSLILTWCADVEYINTCLSWYEYWFWSWIRHWIILPFSFIWSLFSDEIAIYAVNNSWWRYDFWFITWIAIAWYKGWTAVNNSRNND